MSQSKIIEITAEILSRHNNVIVSIEDFPDTIFVGKLKNDEWAKLSYQSFGMGLACFVSKKDSSYWRGAFANQSLDLVHMKTKEAIKLAKKQNIQYLHLLSEDINHPLGHLKTS